METHKSYKAEAFFIKAHNALFITPSFKKTSDEWHWHEADEKVNELLKVICELKEINIRKASWFGWMLAFPDPHAHLILFSTKDRKTGVSVSRLSADEKEFVSEWWKEILEGHSVTIDRIYNFEGCIDYVSGPRNLKRPGQIWKEIKPHNRALILSKSIKRTA